MKRRPDDLMQLRRADNVIVLVERAVIDGDSQKAIKIRRRRATFTDGKKKPLPANLVRKAPTYKILTTVTAAGVVRRLRIS